MLFSLEHNDGERVDILFQLLDSVLEPKSCAYVAGPLDSGKEYYERLAAGEELLPMRKENEERLREFVRSLRKRLAYPVIDPGRLRISAWAGPDYGVFFLDVVQRYARECWFLNGWEYSTGATKEFVFCCATQTPCLSEFGERLTVPEGLRLINGAADLVRRLGMDDAKLRSRADSLGSLS